MRTEWMGRYRELVAALVQHSNVTARTALEIHKTEKSLFLPQVPWQVLEYLIEHEGDDACMNHISEALGIPQSSFSKVARQLTDLGLVERYQRSANRKNIILKPTPLALEIYESQSRFVLDRFFRPFFDALEPLDDASLACVTEALRALNDRLSPPPPPPEEALIKME